MLYNGSIRTIMFILYYIFYISLSKIDLARPLSIILENIFFSIIRIIGPSKVPKIPIVLNPVYIAIRVNIGCIPI